MSWLSQWHSFLNLTPTELRLDLPGFDPFTLPKAHRIDVPHVVYVLARSGPGLVVYGPVPELIGLPGPEDGVLLIVPQDVCREAALQGREDVAFPRLHRYGVGCYGLGVFPASTIAESDWEMWTAADGKVIDTRHTGSGV